MAKILQFPKSPICNICNKPVEPKIAVTDHDGKASRIFRIWGTWESTGGFRKWCAWIDWFWDSEILTLFESAVWGSPRISHVAKPGRNNFAPNLLNYEQSLYTSLRRALRPPVSCAIRWIPFSEAGHAKSPGIYPQAANLQHLQ